MERQSSVQIASQCIDQLLTSFNNKLLEKSLQIVAKKNVANAFTHLQRQFAIFLGTSTTNNKIKPQKQPDKIHRDSLSCYHTNVETNRYESEVLKTQKSTKDRSSSNYTKITTSIKQPSKKQSPIRLKQENFKEVANELEDKLRNLYLLKIKTKAQQQKQVQQNLKKSRKVKPIRIILNQDQFYAYHYDGKVVKGKERSASTNLTALMKSQVSKSASVVKKIKRKRAEQETVKPSFVESTHSKSRRVSIQSKPEKLFENLSVRDTPMFSVIEQKQKNDSQLKLPEFKNLCKKNKAKQYRFFTENRISVELPSISGRPTIQVTNLRSSSKTQTLMSSSVFKSRITRELKHLSADSIKVNPELYESYINQL